MITDYTNEAQRILELNVKIEINKNYIPKTLISTRPNTELGPFLYQFSANLVS